MIYESQSGDLNLVAGGDTMITRKFRVFKEPTFLKLREIFRKADVSFANLEMLMHDFEHSPGTGGGTFTGSDPKNLSELEWLGINLVSCANNHSYDYGEGGLLTNLEHLKQSNLVYSGTGRNLSEARAPAYLDTSAGRVALISASSTFAESGRALDQRPDLLGRPGLNTLRFHTTYEVDKTAFQELQRISQSLGLESIKKGDQQFRAKGSVPIDTETEFHFLGNKFSVDNSFKATTKLGLKDLEGNLKWVRDARRMADWVLISVHCHESGFHRDEPPTFLSDFAKLCIDNGADAFIGHGPHVTRGIEIYKGKPIFYSLGNFVFQNETVRWQPAYNYETANLSAEATPADFYDARSDNDTRHFPSDPLYWESIVAECSFSKGIPKTITLHPIELGHGLPRSQRGRPVAAREHIATKILQRVQALSRPFGTTIEINDNVGTIHI